MVKLTAPYFSIQALRQGPPGLSLRRRAGLTIAEITPTPTDPQTPAQLSQRSLFQEGVASWHVLPAATRTYYGSWPTTTGFNAAYLNFIQEWLSLPPPTITGP